MVRRIKQVRWESWLAGKRYTLAVREAVGDNDALADILRHLLATRRSARILRMTEIQMARQRRSPGMISPMADAQWAHRDYGRKRGKSC